MEPNLGPGANMTTIDEWIARWVPSERIAFRFEGQALSYERLLSRIDAVSAAFVDAGIGVGDRIGFCGLNRIEIFETFFACARLGAILMPLNNRLSVGELRWQIDDGDPALVLTTDGFGPSISAAAGGRAVRDLDEAPFPPSHRPHVACSPEVSIDADVLMVYTSGTTGHPKGAVLTQSAVLHTVLNGVDSQGLGGDDRIITVVPTFHVGGLTIQTMPALYVGAEVILHRRFDPGLVLADITELRPTQTLLVPAMMTAISGHPEFATTDLSCLTGISTGSSVVMETTMEPFFSRGIGVAQVYGATESGPTSIVLSHEDSAKRPTSCGRRTQHTEYRIVDTATGVDVEPGVDGEIWLRGPNLFNRYWNNPTATSEAFEDGWYRTGDIGHRDAEGYVWVSDRLKDMIISGGENVYPAEVEAVLIDHPGIAEIAVIGREDEKWGEVPVAVIVPADVSVNVEVDELHSWSADRLARFKRPRDVITVSTLPRTALGKVQKHLLRAHADLQVRSKLEDGGAPSTSGGS